MNALNGEAYPTMAQPNTRLHPIGGIVALAVTFPCIWKLIPASLIDIVNLNAAAGLITRKVNKLQRVLIITLAVLSSAPEAAAKEQSKAA